jgi:hypothetical protein
MTNDKLLLTVILSAGIDVIGGLLLSLLGVPDPLDILTNIGIQAINSTANTLPTDAPQKVYIMATNSISMLEFLHFAAIMAPFAILIGLILTFLITRNE